jgi:hypothetical protein
MGAIRVGPQARREYLARMRERYATASRKAKSRLLDEVCEVTGYHRKAAIRLLRRPVRARARRRGRPVQYGATVVGALRQIWEAAGYPWSVRLQALLPVWLPWAVRRWRLSREVVERLRAMSPRQMDRCLRPFKGELRKRQYGRTRPGALLKHQIPLKTDRWDVQVPGFTEIDLVAHSGDRADGEFLHSLNVTDIHTTWVETRAVMGKSQHHVQAALEHLRQALPFRLRGIDSDNGSEFINHHLRGYCAGHQIQFTRGRPYKKDDNAHIEQKNWTHVRKLLGYVRYDSAPALTAINALYADLRLLQNLFLPSVKLVEKRRVGARLQRRYDAPRTPFERVEACDAVDGPRLRALQHLRAELDPIALAQRIDHQLAAVYRLANQRVSPATVTKPRVDAAGPVENAKNAFPTRSLENRTERGFPQRPHASSSSLGSVTRLTARRSATR